jgi:hypothetical protein
MARFDLVVTLHRDAPGGGDRELGDVLLSRGISAAEWAALRSEGRIQLVRRLDLEGARALAQKLEVGGTRAELIELPREPAPAVAVDGGDGSVEINFSEFKPTLELTSDFTASRAGGQRHAAATKPAAGRVAPAREAEQLDSFAQRELELEGTAPLALDDEPAPQPSGSAETQDRFAPPPESEEGLAIEQKPGVFAAAPPAGRPAPSTAVGLAIEPEEPLVPALPPKQRSAAGQLPAAPSAEPAPCPRCGAVLASDGACATCEARHADMLRRKLFGGALHDRAPLRLGIGLVLALLVGWIGSAPYSRRAERAVAALQERANELRYRADPDLRAQVALLEEQATSSQTSAAIQVGVLWLLIAGLAFAGWMLLT